MKRSPDWNLLAEGPSVLGVRRESLLDGPVVAVNRAIGMIERLPVTIWCVQDDPALMLDWAEANFPRFSHAKIDAWGNEQDRDGWESIGWAGDRLHLRGWQSCYDDETLEWSILPGLYHAILNAMELGAKRIRVFGADLAGGGCAFPMEGAVGEAGMWSPVEDIYTKRRWAREKQIMAFFADEWAPARGCRIERVGGVLERGIALVGIPPNAA